MFGAHLPVGAVVHLVELVDVVLFAERLEELLGAAACGEDEGVSKPDSEKMHRARRRYSADSLQLGKSFRSDSQYGQ